MAHTHAPFSPLLTGSFSATSTELFPVKLNQRRQQQQEKWNFRKLNVCGCMAVNTEGVEKENVARSWRPSEIEKPVITGGPYPNPAPHKRKQVQPGVDMNHMLLLKPPMTDRHLGDKLLDSPQLRVNSLPVLASCLPIAPLQHSDMAWIYEHILEIREALGFPKEEEDQNFPEEHPAAHFETMLYLSFQHKHSLRSIKSRYVRIGHTRLAFLGNFVLELAMAEFLLQVFPKESVGCLRERLHGLLNKRRMRLYIKSLGLDHLILVTDDLLWKNNVRIPVCKSIFLALIATMYLTLGMSEVYRLLFETFGLDLDEECAQPKIGHYYQDVDKVSADFDGERLLLCMRDQVMDLVCHLI